MTDPQPDFDPDSLLTPLDLDPLVPAPSPAPPPAPAPAPLPSPAPPADKLALEEIWRQLQRDFAFHPRVSISPISGDPPDVYRIEYRLRTLTFDQAGQLVYSDRCELEMRIGQFFPSEPPALRPLGLIFHPNISPDAVSIGSLWNTQTKVSDLVAQVGALLVFKTYDPFAIANPAAAQWAAANGAMLPLDPAANCSPSFGGSPLERICHAAPGALEQARSQLSQAVQALIANEQPIAPGDVRTLCEQIRRDMSIFGEADIPQPIRSTWQDLDDWAHQLPATLPMWTSVRRHRAAASTALGLVQQLADSERVLSREVRAVETIPAPPESDDPTQMLAALPPSAAMLQYQSGLEQAVASAQRRCAQGKTLLDVMGTPLPAAQVASGSLGRRLEAEIGHAKGAIEQVREKVEASLGRVQPLEQRARQTAAALERLAKWREYMDLLQKGRQLAQQASAWGAAGVHAFYIESDGAAHGPFEFEMMLELGGAHVAVRNLGATAIQVIDTDINRVLATDDHGHVVLFIKQSADLPPASMRFNLTARCDELQVQLEYLLRECANTLQPLKADAPAGDSWMHRIVARLRETSSWEALSARHASAMEQWQAMAADLSRLLPYKQRLGLHHLVDRLSRWLPRIRSQQQQSQQHLAEADARIRKIAEASRPDEDTGQLIVPQRFIQEYQQMLQSRQTHQRRLAGVDRALQDAASDLAIRLSTPDNRGSAQVPQFSWLTPLPQELLDLSPSMEDEPMHARVAEVERLMGFEVCPTDWPRKRPQEPGEWAPTPVD